jgi:c(7)-type cytochrome triheme protein
MNMNIEVRSMYIKRISLSSIFILCIIVSISIVSAQSVGHRKARPAYHEYANVMINNVSEKNNIAPVVFNHWLHRAKYTCRLCHVELKFVMKAGGTGITESANIKGLYCGACHNGKEAFAPEEKGQTGKTSKKNCDRCHSYGKKVKFERSFYKYTRDFPRERFGNGINWLKAEKQGLVKLKDNLEGVLPKRRGQENPGETIFKSKDPKMPDIIFSHEKHAVWNGCENCHPRIFSEKKGTNKFTMEEIFAGKYCGTCHGKVSFSTLDCQRCHVKRML